MERVLTVGECSNFRDLGGYTAASGKETTRWRRVYRSDELSKIANTEDNVKLLTETLGIGYTVDFRSDAEVQRSPYAFPGVVRVPVPIDPGNVLRILGENPKLTAKAATDAMIGLNELLVEQFKAEYKKFFDTLLRGAREQKGVVFHCTAGKDRTGYAAALLLMAMGIPEDTVMEDYLLTNQHFKPPATASLSSYGIEPEEGALKALFYVDRPYLNNALRVIKERYHDVPQFVQKELGITSEEFGEIRAFFMEATA